MSTALESPRQSVTLTGAFKTHADWTQDLEKYLQIGDSVDEEMEMYFLEVLWPAYFDSTLIQIGEPCDHGGPGDRARYSTIQKHAGVWIYTGRQAKAVRVTIGKPAWEFHSMRSGALVDRLTGLTADDARAAFAAKHDVEPGADLDVTPFLTGSDLPE